MPDEIKETLSENSRAILAGVHPELARRVEGIADSLALESIFIQVDAGIRTAGMQDAIWAPGHTLPGKAVTNARGYQSNHVMGCAVDVYVEDVGTRQPDWNPAHPDWQRIVALAPMYGLRDGKSWHDLPHLELIEIPTEPPSEIQQLCEQKGVSAVWEKLAIPTFDLPSVS